MLAFLAYSTGFGGPFLFDDFVALSANALLQIDGTVFDAWRSASLSSGSGPLRRPIAMFTFALNHVALGGLSPFALKLVNGLIHAAIGALIYLLASALFAQLRPGADRTQARWLGLLTAAIWLLHPLHVSTVLYAVQRMAQLAALFMVAGLLVFVRYRRAGRVLVRALAEVAGSGPLVGAAHGVRRLQQGERRPVAVAHRGGGSVCLSRRLGRAHRGAAAARGRRGARPVFRAVAAVCVFPAGFSHCTFRAQGIQPARAGADAAAPALALPVLAGATQPRRHGIPAR